MSDIYQYTIQSKHQLVFEGASEMLDFTENIKITAKQIERICHYHGEQIEENIQEEINTGADKIYPDNEDVYYVMMDGSMYLTREDKWNEMKLGRIFKADDNIKISNKRGLVAKSEYICHLGTHTDFPDKLGVYTESLKNPVFINDGARWIWDWVESYYPNAIQILGFYHAKEHLCQFAGGYFKNEEKKKNWIEQKCEQLLDDKIEIVIKDLEKMIVKNEKIKKMKIFYGIINHNCITLFDTKFLKP